MSEKFNFLIETVCFQDGLSAEDDFISYMKEKFENAKPFKLAKEIELVKLTDTKFEIQTDYKFNKNIIRLYLAKYLNYAQLKDYMRVKGTVDGFVLAENEE